MPRKARTVPWVDWRDGVAYACWYDPKARRTQRISLGARDPGAAQTAFSEFLAKGTDVYKPNAINGLLLSTALEDYYQENRRKKISGHLFPTTKSHIMRHLGHIFVKDIGKPECDAYERVRLEEGAAVGTIRNELGIIKTAAKHAASYRRLKADEMPQITMPEPPPHRERWLTHEELARLRVALPERPDFTDFVDLCYWTASRKTAILMLTKFQVDLTNQRIKLAKPNEVKTKKRRPVVPIAMELLPTVQRLMKETPGEYLLPERSYDWWFEKACEREKIEDASPHTLRHTRITHLLQQGVAPWAVGGLAGLNVMTVVTIYGHQCPGHLAEAMEAIKREKGS